MVSGIRIAMIVNDNELINSSVENKPKRKRNYYFENAVKITHELIDNYTMDRIINNGYYYLLSITTKTVLLYDAVKDEILKLPYTTRFDKKYSYKQKHKIDAIFRQIPPDIPSLFITLTLDPKMFYSYADMHVQISYAFNKLITEIVQFIKSGKDPDHKIIAGTLESFVKVVEMQKNGDPHIHVILNGISYIDVAWLHEHWKVGTYVHLDPVLKNRSKLYAYLMKYFVKAMHVDSTITPYTIKKQWFKTTVLKWALRIRTFSCSRIFNLHENNYNGRWEYLDTIDKYNADSITHLIDYSVYISDKRYYGERVKKVNDNG